MHFFSLWVYNIVINGDVAVREIHVRHTWEHILIVIDIVYLSIEVLRLKGAFWNFSN